VGWRDEIESVFLFLVCELGLFDGDWGVGTHPFWEHFYCLAETRKFFFFRFSQEWKERLRVYLWEKVPGLSLTVLAPVALPFEIIVVIHVDTWSLPPAKSLETEAQIFD
jgi:hypothetical protein